MTMISKEDFARKTITEWARLKEPCTYKPTCEHNVPSIFLETFFNNYNNIKLYGSSLEAFGNLPTQTFKDFLDRNGTLELLLTEKLEPHSIETPSLISKFLTKYEKNITVNHVDLQIIKNKIVEKQNQKKSSLIEEIKALDTPKFEEEPEEDYEEYFITADDSAFIFKEHHKYNPKSYFFYSFNNIEEAAKLNNAFEYFKTLKN